MSLMRLLMTGKSWVGLKDSAARYQMTDSRAMPKFGQQPRSRSQEPREAKDKGAPIKQPAAQNKGEWGWDFVRGLRQLFGSILRGSARSAKVVPRFNTAPVQGELTLDRIKVVRNDLSDADLEVVPAHPVAQQAANGSEPSGNSNVGAEKPSSREAERLVGAAER